MASAGEGGEMVYRYTGVSKRGEEHVETGVVVARNKTEAHQKLKPLGYDRVDFKKLRGWSALVSRLTADVR